MPRSTRPCTSSSSKRASRRSPILALALALSSLPAGGARAQQDWREAVAEVLDRRAAAVLAGDREAFRETMDGAPVRFIRDRLAWFDRMAELPIAGYALELEDDASLDLAAAARRLPDAAEVHVVAVRERMRLRTFDARAAVEELILTVVRRRDRWSVVGDDALDDLGLFSARSVWDLGAVRSRAVGNVLAITRADPDAARGLARRVADAITFVEREWPLAWQERAVLVIPCSAAELERVFETTVDLSPFVAFASASLVRRADGRVRTAAPRIYLQPETFSRQPASFQREILSHEVLHVAAGARAGVFTPSWLEEGVALVYGESNDPDTARLAASIARGTFPRRLPEGQEFFLGSEDQINTSYEASGSFITYLADRFGDDAPARFYAALGRESTVSFGTARYHLDRASDRVFGLRFGALERAWVRAVERRSG